MDVVAERVLAVGMHTIELEVDDGTCTNSASVVIEVITAGSALDRCATLLANTPMDSHHRRGLSFVLQEAVKELDKSKFDRAMSRLQSFIAMVMVAPSIDDADKTALVDCADAILDSL
jgi:hypothetical protein